MYMKNFGEFFNNQVEHAGTIVLSRTQSMTDEKLEECAALLRGHNGHAAMITTPWDELDGKQILAAMHHVELEMEEHHHHHEECGHEHHHHDGECAHEHHHEHDEHCTCGCCDQEHHHHHADEVFTSWGVETAHKYTAEELQQILEELGGSEKYGVILRAKGIIPGTDGGWMQFDFVPEEYEVRGGSPDYTGRLCVIGSKLNEEALKELFHII